MEAFALAALPGTMSGSLLSGLSTAGSFLAGAAPLLSAGTAALQFSQQKGAADLTVLEGNIAAQQEELAATQREADRKERLATAMASQSASAGSRGVLAFEGSPLTVLQEDVRREEQATDRDRFNARLQAMTKKARSRSQAGTIRTSANIGLATSLADVAKTL